jgi:hypothetical protein
MSYSALVDLMLGALVDLKLGRLADLALSARRSGSSCSLERALEKSL